MEQVPRFMTIRDIAKTGILTEYTLRKLEKQKKLPCVYCGTRCLVNYDSLIDWLSNLKGGEEND